MTSLRSSIANKIAKFADKKVIHRKWRPQHTTGVHYNYIIKPDIFFAKHKRELTVTEEGAITVK